MWEVIWDETKETLWALPILLIVYILIEFMEHKGEVKFEKIVASSKKYGPIWGSGLGVIPQCGFSAVMADLFSKKMITIGTLFAVFVATSDEAFAILVATPERIGSLAVLIGLKLVLAIAIGYTLDLIFKHQSLKADLIEHNKHMEHEHSHKHQKDEENCKTCDEEEKSCETCKHDHLHHSHELEDETKQSKAKVFWDIVWQGVKHTLEIFAYILIATIVIALIIYFAGGEEALMSIVSPNAWYIPLVCALIGLIPNCAGSVALVELYTSGVISFSACLGGLCTAAGIGLMVLYKNNKNIKMNLAITAGLYLFGVVVGTIFNLFMPAMI